MFELVILALICLAAAMIIVWLYRKLTRFKGASVVSLSGNRARLELGQQQGYVSWESMGARKRSKRVAASESNAKPWGW